MSLGKLCLQQKNNIYFGHTTNTFSRWLNFYLNDTSNIAKICNSIVIFYENNKHKRKIIEAIYIKRLTPTHNEINYE